MAAETVRTETPKHTSGIGYLPRLLRLLWLYGRLDLLWVTRDMRTFLSWTLSEIVISLASVTGMWLLSERFLGIGVWTRPQVLFLLGYAATVSGLTELLFGYNVAMISRRIGRGQLDHTLIQPQPLWLSLLTEGFVPISGSLVVLPGVGLMLWGLHRLPIHITLIWILWLMLSLAASVGVALAYQFVWGSIAFWAPRSAEEINTSTSRLVDQLKPYPLDGLGIAMTGGLLSVLPIGFVAWMPCHALIGLSVSPYVLWATPIAALVFGLLAAGLFRLGMRHYGRVGSQRYSPFGHRN